MMKQLNRCTVTIMSSNLGDSISFYKDALGLKLIQNYGGHYAELDAAGFRIGLHPTTDPIKIGDNMSVGFGVSDFDMNVQSLKDSGLNPRITQDGPIRLAHFSDPDGNHLYLAEILRDR